jgi:hypothetical protein
MLGGLVRAYVDRKYPSEAAQERGILFSSGLIGGDACIGILIALFTVLKIIPPDAPPWLPDWVSFGTFIALALSIVYFVGRKK